MRTSRASRGLPARSLDAGLQRRDPARGHARIDRVTRGDRGDQSRIHLGILVAAATFRHPALYAKSLCTIDQISRGRTIAGIGAGWQENEHSTYGIRLGPTAERIDRFE